MLVALAGAAVPIYAPAVGILPLGEDNFYALSWIDRATAGSLVTLDPGIYPEWRPLAYLTVWLQYQWSGLERLGDYYVVNIALWIGAAWLVYLIVNDLTRSVIASMTAACVVLVDSRAVSSVAWIIERQSSLCCVFGLIAVRMALGADSVRPINALRACALATCLVASALSKEYGLAFAGALIVFALWQRRRDLALPSAGAAAIYASLRLVLAGGALAPYCQDMGLFDILRSNVCISGVDNASLPQMIYNVAATAVGSLLPGFFDVDGRLGLSLVALAIGATWLTVAAWGSRQHRVAWHVAALVVAANAALSILLYQPRNQVTALCAIGIAVGLGIAALQTQAWWVRGPRVVRAGLVMTLASVIVLQGWRTHRELTGEVGRLALQHPCAQLAETPEFAPIARRLQSSYGAGFDCQDLNTDAPAPN